MKHDAASIPHVDSGVVRKKERKKRKNIYIALFCMPYKALKHAVLSANYAMPAFLS